MGRVQLGFTFYGSVGLDLVDGGREGVWWRLRFTLTKNWLEGQGGAGSAGSAGRGGVGGSCLQVLFAESWNPSRLSLKRLRWRSRWCCGGSLVLFDQARPGPIHEAPVRVGR